MSSKYKRSPNPQQPRRPPAPRRSPPGKYVSIEPDLKAWRARMGFTQKQAAEHLQVNLRTYQGWELGRSPILRAVLLKTIGALPETAKS